MCIQELEKEFITQASCGEYFTIFLNRENKPFFTGRLGDSFGSGIKSLKITKLNGLPKIQSIFAGNHTAFFLTSKSFLFLIFSGRKSLCNGICNSWRTWIRKFNHSRNNSYINPKSCS